MNLCIVDSQNVIQTVIAEANNHIIPMLIKYIMYGRRKKSIPSSFKSYPLLIFKTLEKAGELKFKT